MQHRQKLLGTTLALATAFCTQAAHAEDNNPLSFDLGAGNNLTFYGYIKGTYIKDYDFDLGDTTKGLATIGLPGGSPAGEHERTHLKETRIGLTYTAPDLLIKLEGDFFGADGLRTRLAYVDFFGVRVGQDWSNFMSLENLGPTVDFQGPAGVPFARLLQARYTYAPTPDWTFSASVEEDVGNNDDPHFTLAARRGFDGGMVRLAGLYRDTTIGGTPVEGWGLSLGATYDVWQGGTLAGIYTTGEGISDILAFGLSGNALVSGGKTVGVNAVSVSLKQQISEKLTVAATLGMTDLDTAAGTDTKKLTTVHLSAYYNATKNLQLGLEYFTGTRKQGNGTSFDADRVTAAVKYTF
ncbi:hypothetical protein [Shimia aestuarii]|uniref:Porin n=1 Tax=Shimia aestuarii TaxID=254406 RepID=A0A1I4S998_9RHOB|nr:hypothetical protein [Shimia aestuarii]SFM61065.1 hypothetical protein SAMN04488042_11059 [Shimia aestuarii]